MFSMFYIVFIAVTFINAITASSPNHETHMKDGREVIVQMFEWRHDDIADECENYLGPAGFGAVQVSPVAEHIVLDSGPNPFPWWQRYQTVSYKLGSRSGDLESIKNMISRCNKVGVRIYFDVIINHMTANGKGKGNLGTDWDGDKFDYPGVPFNISHFNSKDKCGTADGSIHNSEDIFESRNCELSGLHDLDQSIKYVRDKQVEFFNSLTKLGVAGFRVDATKHMYPETLRQTFDDLDDLPSSEFGSDKKPFMYHEISAWIVGPGIKSQDYVGVGKILNFKYMHYMRDVFQKLNNRKLSDLKNFGPSWNMLDSDDNVAILDNHDLQRSYYSSNIQTSLSFRHMREMKMATAFMLAWPYGTPKILSSYNWQVKFADSNNMTDLNNWIGPPANGYEIEHVKIDKDGNCNQDKWICEHRIPVIRNMVKFRRIVENQKVTNWWSDKKHAIAFERSGRGFIVINNNQNEKIMDLKLITSLPPGTYCDVISGDLDKETCKCTGKQVEVSFGQTVRITIDPKQPEPMIAFHVQSLKTQANCLGNMVG